MDDLTLLQCYLDWGADEALQSQPRDRLILPEPIVPAVRSRAPAVAAATLVQAVAAAQAAAAAAGSLPELRAALTGFAECPLQAHRDDPGLCRRQRELGG